MKSVQVFGKMQGLSDCVSSQPLTLSHLLPPLYLEIRDPQRVGHALKAGLSSRTQCCLSPLELKHSQRSQWP